MKRQKNTTKPITIHYTTGMSGTAVCHAPPRQDVTCVRSLVTCEACKQTDAFLMPLPGEGLR